MIHTCLSNLQLILLIMGVIFVSSLIGSYIGGFIDAWRADKIPKMSMADEARARGRSHWRGHPTLWEEKAKRWVFADTMEPTVGWGGKKRPCGKCGKLFEGSYNGEVDPCFGGKLPGVVNACCGHGVRREAYILFKNGPMIRGFDKIEP